MKKETNMEQDLISIVIPCYNCAKTVSRTLDSILYQTYKNLEIILVNDGSKDNTQNVLETYAKNDARIKIVNQTNHGVAYARNNGIKNATGKFMMFLDSDDNYTTPVAIEKMMETLKKENADMTVCRFIHPCYEMYLDAGVYDLTNHSDFIAYYDDFFACSMPWNKLIKRECLTEEYVNGVKLGEDELYNLDNLHNIKKVVVLNEFYHNYYCAPYIPLDDASAITKASRDNVNSFWDLFMNNQPLRDKSIRQFFPEHYDEMIHIRCFDFAFWAFFIMAKNRVDEDVIEDTFCALFNKDLFIKGVKRQERYGLKLKNFDKKDIKEFCKTAYFMFRDIKLYNKKLYMFKVFLLLFCRYFYEQNGEINTIDIVAKMFKEMNSKKLPEAIYVRHVLKNISKHTAKNDIQYLTSNMTSWFGNTSWTGDGIKEN